MTMLGCTGNTEHKLAADTKPKNNIQELSKPVSSYNDTLIINTESAVFYNPDSMQLEKIRTVNKKNIAESMEHDCFYQMRNARMVLKKYWPQVNIIETANARFLLFIKADKTKHCIDLNGKNDMCGIILFNRQKDPELVDMMNIDTALEFYFSNK
ncbi:hypothetical protein BH11BAC4_BH11BAC4_22880 [soil metagenome]